MEAIKTPSQDWKKTLYILWGAQFLAMIGMSSCVPFLPLYIRELGVTAPEATAKWSGLIYAAPFMVATIAVPVWGALGDKFGRKMMVVRAVLGLGIAMLLMGFVTSVEQLFLLRLFQGGVSGFIASTLSLVAAETPEEHSGYAIGLIQTSVSAGTIIGPLIGGVVADTFSIRALFYGVAFLCLIAGIIIIVAVQEKKIYSEQQKKANTVVDNIKYVWQHPPLFRLLVYVLAIQSGIVMLMPIMAYYVESFNPPEGILATGTGIMIGITGVLSTLFAPYWGRKNDKQGFQKTLLQALPITAGATLLHAVAPTLWSVFPLRALLGIALAACVPTLYTALSKRSPEHIRGGIMGLASSATLLGNLGAPLLSGWIAAEWGLRWCFVAAASTHIAVMAVVFYNKSRGR